MPDSSGVPTVSTFSSIEGFTSKTSLILDTETETRGSRIKIIDSNKNPKITCMAYDENTIILLNNVKRVAGDAAWLMMIAPIA